MNSTQLKITLSYIGFIPFVFFGLMPWIYEKYDHIFLSLHIFYGSIVLSFLAGFFWNKDFDQEREIRNVFIGIAFSVLAILIAFVTYFNFLLAASIFSMIVFYLIYIFEKNTIFYEDQDEEFQELRKTLTLLVCISFLISSAYSINPYN